MKMLQLAAQISNEILLLKLFRDAQQAKNMLKYVAGRCFFFSLDLFALFNFCFVNCFLVVLFYVVPKAIYDCYREK